ncbi:bifunctional riboflavin kinase/FAD synthetase [Alicyclobacillus tolerans]|uniref:Riboflavin biosynthesis protein n=1 Tax=Alicyclobacillus tolerans TaxID=90970 RepID=A0A1M6RJ95_9BACL|nr:bifunctional riboflavin kinase/FAD synthetase [Alicyclobacillus montanus]SHK32561.1 riboflavin kinase / FMN adenylyltransferase [Alicyclobacillus montanus]
MLQRIDIEGPSFAAGEILSPCVLAIGKFDGVHIGHQAILAKARAELASDSRAGQVAVLSFQPHPTYVLTGDEQYLRLLTPLPEKTYWLEQFGVERLYLAHFNQVFMNTSPEEFLANYLLPLGAKSIVVGHDFRFGQGGRATAEELAKLCQPHNIPVNVVHHVEENGIKVSSSQIRKHLQTGRVEAAEALLGRPYGVTGLVETGDKRGRELGFPTANIGKLDSYVLPKRGVYVVAVDTAPYATSGRHWFGVANLGVRPTVDGVAEKLEVHLLDFSGDLYGSTLRIQFLRRIRDEKKFASLAELETQIREDVQIAREMLGMGQTS